MQGREPQADSVEMCPEHSFTSMWGHQPIRLLPGPHPQAEHPVWPINPFHWADGAGRKAWTERARLEEFTDDSVITDKRKRVINVQGGP